MYDAKAELRDFLKSRRARLSPDDVGLTGGGLRRVAGLRREEVAALSGLNPDYYARLEQGRLPHVSNAVLDSVARALHLDDSEHRHLVHLARPSDARGLSVEPQRVREEVLVMIAALEAQPAFVIGNRLDVLAANWMTAQVMGDWLDRPQNQRNLARFIFLDPEARDIHQNWRGIAEEAVATLSHYAGQHPDDPELALLVDDLRAQSPEFAAWWASHDVRSRSFGTTTYLHPRMGELILNCESLAFPGDAQQRLCIFSAEPHSHSHRALVELASVRSPMVSAASAESGL